MDRPAAVSLAFISARTEAAAAENWRDVIDGSVEELVRHSLETPSGRVSDLTSGYRLGVVCSASGEVAAGRLISRMVSVDRGEARRFELGKFLIMRSGCVVSPSSAMLGGENGRGLRDGVGELTGKTIVFFREERGSPSSSISSSVSMPSVCLLTSSSIACTNSDTLFCLVHGVSGGSGKTSGSSFC